MKTLEYIVVGTAIFCFMLAAFILVMSINPAVGKELVIASSYGDPHDIKRTGEKHIATGSQFDPSKMAAAHRTLPFGTYLTLKHGHRSCVVVINDRGPFIRGRTLDLTPAANKYLQCGGLCKVKIEHWPPLPKPKPYIETAIIWGEENESEGLSR